jgi:phage terminase small subunit
MSATKKAANAALENLTPQRRKFVLAYCDTLNGAKAALAAGYSEISARQQAHRLLTNDDIKAAVKSVLGFAGMNVEEIAARWDRLARADLADFYTKVEYEEKTKVTRPLLERIAELEYERDFEERVAKRQTLDEDEAERHYYRQLRRRNDIIRCQVELEMNPAATYLADGPPIKKYRMEIDLVKAADLGLLDLVKGIAEGRNGVGLTLRDVDAALDNLAKWRGMLVNKVDLTSGGEPVAQRPIMAVLTIEQKKELLAAKRKAAAQAGEGQADA